MAKSNAYKPDRYYIRELCRDQRDFAPLRRIAVFWGAVFVLAVGSLLLVANVSSLPDWLVWTISPGFILNSDMVAWDDKFLNFGPVLLSWLGVNLLYWAAVLFVVRRIAPRLLSSGVGKGTASGAFAREERVGKVVAAKSEKL
jgi:hypothetical protein